MSKGEKYAKALSEALSKEFRGWEELKALYFPNGDYTEGSLILIHPSWYNGESDEPKTCEVRGDRHCSDPVQPEEQCASEELWGYECPFQSEKLVWDHKFPFSLGGPTDVDGNLQVLCRKHNLVKASDWHIFDLSNEPDWFDGVLDLVAKRVPKDRR